MGDSKVESVFGGKESVFGGNESVFGGNESGSESEFVGKDRTTEDEEGQEVEEER
jgi:hypothetical protein